MLPFVMRTIGLDVGSKTIGLAVSDELNLCAHSLKTHSRRGTIKDTLFILELCRQYHTQQVVIGLPYDCEGNEGHRASRVRVLGDSLQEKGLTIFYQDESFSTVKAEALLLEGDLSRTRRKQLIDSTAAAIILQDWLDEHKKGT